MAVANQWRNVGELGTDPIPDIVPNILDSLQLSWVDMDYIVGRIQWFMSICSDSIKSHLVFNAFSRLSTMPEPSDQTQATPQSVYEANAKREALRWRRALVAYTQTSKLIEQHAQYKARLDFNPEVECSPFTGSLVDHQPDADHVASGRALNNGTFSGPTIMAAVADTLKHLETVGDFVTETILTPGVLMTDHEWLEKEYLCVIIARLQRSGSTTTASSSSSSSEAKSTDHLTRSVRDQECLESVVTDTLLWQLFWRLYFNVTIAVLPHLSTRMQGVVTMGIQNEICRDIFRTQYSLLTPNEPLLSSQVVPTGAWIPGFEVAITSTDNEPQSDHGNDESHEPAAKITRRGDDINVTMTYGDMENKKGSSESLQPLVGVVPTAEDAEKSGGVMRPPRNELLNGRSKDSLAVALDKEKALLIMPIITVIIDSVEKAQIYAQQFGTRDNGALERIVRPFRSRDRSPCLHQFLMRLGKGCTTRLQEAAEQFGDLMVGSDPPPGEAETTQCGRADVAKYVSMAFLSATDYIPVPRNDLSAMTTIPLNRPPISLVVLSGMQPRVTAGNCPTAGERKDTDDSVLRESYFSSMHKPTSHVHGYLTQALKKDAKETSTTSIPAPGQGGRWAAAARKAEALGYTKVALVARSREEETIDGVVPDEESSFMTSTTVASKPLPTATIAVVRSEYGNVLTLQLLLFMFHLTLTQLNSRKSSWGDKGGRKVPHNMSTDYATLSALLPELVAVDQRLVKTVRDYLASQPSRRSRGSKTGNKLHVKPTTTVTAPAFMTLQPQPPTIVAPTGAVPSFEICRTLFLVHFDDFVWFTGTLAVQTNLWRTLQQLQADMIVDRTTGLRNDSKGRDDREKNSDSCFGASGSECESDQDADECFDDGSDSDPCMSPLRDSKFFSNDTIDTIQPKIIDLESRLMETG